MSDKPETPNQAARPALQPWNIPQDSLDKVLAYLNQKLAGRGCPVCGITADRWRVEPNVFGIPVVEWLPGLPNANRTLPTIVMVCENCGNTVFISAVMAGLKPPGSPDV
jgi:hypothetical protein